MKKQAWKERREADLEPTLQNGQIGKMAYFETHRVVDSLDGRLKVWKGPSHVWGWARMSRPRTSRVLKPKSGPLSGPQGTLSEAA